MASIRKRGTSWQVQIRKKGHRTVTETFNVKANADAWARKIESEIERGLVGPNFRATSTVTLSELITRYVETVTPKKKSYVQEGNRLRKLSHAPFTRIAAANVTAHDIACFRDQRLSEVGSQAVRHDLNALSQVFSTAMGEWSVALNGNPVDSVKKPPPSSARQRRLAEQERERLMTYLNRCGNSDLRDLVFVALYTAMRKGEILRIEAPHYVSGSRLLHVPVTKNGCPRTIPLCSVSKAILDNRLKHHAQRLFPFDEAWCRYHWNKLLEDVGIADLHFHDLRHEAVSRFFERGMSVPEVALISGHKDFRMLARYTHLRAEDVAAKLA